MIPTNREEIEKLRKEFPIGTRVELVTVDSNFAPTLKRGTVTRFKDGGTFEAMLDEGDKWVDVAVEDLPEPGPLVD